jgi:predicted SPOUT superfamily RNA methylase MTH1
MSPVAKKPKLRHSDAATGGKQQVGLISVAVPASALSFAGPTGEHQTLVSAQIARALLVHGVHQVFVYPDARPLQQADAVDPATEGGDFAQEEVEWLCRQLEYLECPPYLRRGLYETSEGGMSHEALEYCKALPGGGRMDAVHHLRASEWTRFREGVVGDDKKSVDIGLSKRGILGASADAGLEGGMRVTFEFDKDVTRESEIYRGQIVDPMKPVLESRSRLSWGYMVKPLDNNGLDEILNSGEFHVKILFDWKEGQTLKKIESKLVGTLLNKPSTTSVLLVLPPVHRSPFRLVSDNPTSSDDKFDVRLNPVEMAQTKFIKVEELLLSGLAHLRSPLVAWIKRLRSI